MRERLPNTRQSITHKLVLSHTMPSGKAKRLHIYITVGLYDDGRPAELFYRINKADDTISGFCKMWAIAVSLCLQSGVTLEKLVEKFAFQDFPPNGFTENKDLRSCKSICDYTIRWMEKEFSQPAVAVSASPATLSTPTPPRPAPDQRPRLSPRP